MKITINNPNFQFFNSDNLFEISSDEVNVLIFGREYMYHI